MMKKPLNILTAALQGRCQDVEWFFHHREFLSGWKSCGSTLVLAG